MAWPAPGSGADARCAGVCFYQRESLPGYSAIFRHPNDELNFCYYLIPCGKDGMCGDVQAWPVRCMSCCGCSGQACVWRPWGCQVRAPQDGDAEAAEVDRLAPQPCNGRRTRRFACAHCHSSVASQRWRLRRPCSRPGSPRADTCGGGLQESDLKRLHEGAIKSDPFISTALGPKAEVERMKAAALRLGGQGLRTTFDDHLLIIGDAAGHIDPLTGEGIHTAMMARAQPRSQGPGRHAGCARVWEAQARTCPAGGCVSGTLRELTGWAGAGRQGRGRDGAGHAAGRRLQPRVLLAVRAPLDGRLRPRLCLGALYVLPSVHGWPGLAPCAWAAQAVWHTRHCSWLTDARAGRQSKAGASLMYKYPILLDACANEMQRQGDSMMSKWAEARPRPWCAAWQRWTAVRGCHWSTPR